MFIVSICTKRLCVAKGKRNGYAIHRCICEDGIGWFPHRRSSMKPHLRISVFWKTPKIAPISSNG